MRAGEITKEMIIELVQEDPVPHTQMGDGLAFKRRTPAEGDIGNLNRLSQVFDYIRMLDADGYPAAFLQMNHLRMEFSRASLKDGYVLADVKITMREEEDV